MNQSPKWPADSRSEEKNRYQSPVFHIFGNVRDITQTQGNKSPMTDGATKSGTPKFKSL